MRPPAVNVPLMRLIALCMLVTLPTSLLQAQANGSSIRRALYVALGGDPVSGVGYPRTPLAVSAGVEQSHAGSRWALRLGADYRRQTSNVLGDQRWEDFGLGLSARYGRASGAIRPYLLGGAGVANLRTRVRNARYYADPAASLFAPQSYDVSRWNGSLTTGLGTDFTVGHLKLFTEARLNLYPGRLGQPQNDVMRTTKAFYLGVKF